MSLIHASAVVKCHSIRAGVREGEEGKIRALDLGADDYLTKPFSTGGLIARMRAVLCQTGTTSGAEPPLSTTGDLTIDFAHRKVTVAGTEVHLLFYRRRMLRTKLHKIVEMLTTGR